MTRTTNSESDTSPDTSPVDATCAVSIEGLSHTYSERRALRSIDLEIRTGCLHGLVGPNGAGKSTLLKILATLLETQSGLVTVMGMSVAEDAQQIRRCVGYLSEHPAAYLQMTCFEMLDFCGAIHGRNLAERDVVIAAALETVGLVDRRDHVVGTLSRGQQRRVGVARVLIHDPDLLIFDEPAAGLDPRARIELMKLMVDLRGCGKTVLISSHILAELGDLCDSVTVLDRGRVRFSGAVDELPVGDGELGSYELRVLHENEAIGEIVSAVDGVLEVVRLEAATAWRVVCRLGQTDCRQLLEILVERGIVVESFVRQQSRLNEAFLSLTTRGVE